MHDLDSELERRLHGAMTLSAAEEDAVWRRFRGTLPDRQGWLAFQIAMEAAQEHVRRAMVWVHRAARPMPRAILRGRTRFSTRSNRDERG
jgi:hypothetical protein